MLLATATLWIKQTVSFASAKRSSCGRTEHQANVICMIDVPCDSNVIRWLWLTITRVDNKTSKTSNTIGSFISLCQPDWNTISMQHQRKYLISFTLKIMSKRLIQLTNFKWQRILENILLSLELKKKRYDCGLVQEIKLTDENNKSKKWGVDRNGLHETKV